MSIGKKHYTTREAAMRAGLVTEAIRADIRKGRIKAEMVNGGYLIDAESFEIYLKGRKDKRMDGKE